jgi:hypothetical protein
MPAATHGYEDAVPPCELDGVDHIGRPGAPDYQRRTTHVHGVENAVIGVSRVAGFQNVSTDLR